MVYQARHDTYPVIQLKNDLDQMEKHNKQMEKHNKRLINSFPFKKQIAEQASAVRNFIAFKRTDCSPFFYTKPDFSKIIHHLQNDVWTTVAARYLPEEPTSFTGQALLIGAKSDWINPSPFATTRIDDARSGEVILKENLEKNTRPQEKKKYAVISECSQALSFVSRFVYGAAVGIIIAPIGACFHLSKAAIQPILSLIGRGDCTLAAKHLNAGFNDLAYLTLTIVFLAGPILYALSPEKTTVRFHPLSKRIGLAGSLLAKKTLGLVKQNGAILNCDYIPYTTKPLTNWELRYLHIELIDCLSRDLYLKSNK